MRQNLVSALESCSRHLLPEVKWVRGGSSPELKGGGAICRVGAKNTVKSKRAEGAQNFLRLNSGKVL